MKSLNVLEYCITDKKTFEPKDFSIFQFLFYELSKNYYFKISMLCIGLTFVF